MNMATEAVIEAASITTSPTIYAGEKLQGTKRAAATGDGPDAPPHKVTKRRAARACVSCRARKVRCDVVEGAPCGNCRWDNVEVSAAPCLRSFESAALQLAT